MIVIVRQLAPLAAGWWLLITQALARVIKTYLKHNSASCPSLESKKVAARTVENNQVFSGKYSVAIPLSSPLSLPF
jgi:hypothetical protein